MRFKEGNHKKALSAYHKVFCYINGLQPQTGNAPVGSNSIPMDKVEDVKKLKLASHLNMAACYLKLEEPHKCVQACTKAIDVSAMSSKAFFRRAQGQAELRNFGDARMDLQRARELSPKNREVAAELHRLKAMTTKTDEDERKQFGGFLDKGPKEADTVPTMKDDAGQEEASLATSAPQTPEAVERPEQDGKHEAPEEAEERPAPPERTIDVDAQDEARRLDITVRPLTYAWEQTEETVKIYIPFDQSEELEGGVDRDRVTHDFGEWNILVVIESEVEGRPPLGLRLGDFQQRIDPRKSKCVVRSSRISITLVKREKSHWFNLLQKGSSA